MSEEKTNKSKQKFKPKIITPLLAVVVLVILVALFIKNMNGPSVGSIAYTNSSQSAIKPTTANVPKKYDGKYINFTYPEHYKIVPSPPLNGGYVEIVSLESTDHTGKDISIGVIKETLSNDSGINYRKGHPELYRQTEFSPNKVVFAGIGSTAEQTGFIAHNGFVATVSIVANVQKDLSSDFSTIVGSLTFKQ
jgi:hypothetical protein